MQKGTIQAFIFKIELETVRSAVGCSTTELLFLDLLIIQNLSQLVAVLFSIPYSWEKCLLRAPRCPLHDTVSQMDGRIASDLQPLLLGRRACPTTGFKSPSEASRESSSSTPPPPGPSACTAGRCVRSQSQQSHGDSHTTLSHPAGRCGVALLQPWRSLRRRFVRNRSPGLLALVLRDDLLRANRCRCAVAACQSH